MSDNKRRLVTRSDFDGLVCAMILKELDIIDDILILVMIFDYTPSVEIW